MDTQDQSEDRRGTDRRLQVLERHYQELASKVDHVSLEQVHQRELINTRFGTIEKTLELVSTQVTGLSTSIALMTSDPSNSPAGRAVLREITDLRQQHTRDIDAVRADYTKEFQRRDDEYHDLDRRHETTLKEFGELQREVNEARGAVNFASRLGIGSLLGFVGIVAFGLLKLMKVIP